MRFSNRAATGHRPRPDLAPLTIEKRRKLYKYFADDRRQARKDGGARSVVVEPGQRRPNPVAARASVRGGRVRRRWRSARSARSYGARGLVVTAEASRGARRGSRGRGGSVSRSSASTIASAGPGPSTSATATARLSATTAFGSDREQLVVELEHLAPVGVGRGRGVAVHRVDGGLDLVRAGLVALQAAPHDRLAFGDEVAVPSGAVLIGEQHHGSVGRGARRRGATRSAAAARAGRALRVRRA